MLLAKTDAQKRKRENVDCDKDDEKSAGEDQQVKEFGFSTIIDMPDEEVKKRKILEDMEDLDGTSVDTSDEDNTMSRAYYWQDHETTVKATEDLEEDRSGEKKIVEMSKDTFWMEDETADKEAESVAIDLTGDAR